MTAKFERPVNPKISRMLHLIKNIWFKYPDLRLMQLLENCISRYEDSYFVDDDDLYQKLLNTYKEVKP